MDLSRGPHRPGCTDSTPDCTGSTGCTQYPFRSVQDSFHARLAVSGSHVTLSDGDQLTLGDGTRTATAHRSKPTGRLEIEHRLSCAASKWLAGRCPPIRRQGLSISMRRLRQVAGSASATSSDGRPAGTAARRRLAAPHPQRHGLRLAPARPPPGQPAGRPQRYPRAGLAGSGSQRHRLGQRPLPHRPGHHLRRRHVNRAAHQPLHFLGELQQREQPQLLSREVHQQVNV
jgi:hypothetical protein